MSSPSPIFSSPWGDQHQPCTVHRLNAAFGNAQQSVLVSFYDAPECVIEVMVDSDLPLDLDLTEHCQECVEIRSFRDLLPQLWDLYPVQWSDPPGLDDYRTQELTAEIEDDADEPTMWDLIRRGGSTWCSGPPKP